MLELKYKKILENISDWIWEVNADGVYTYCSENVYNYLGYKAQDVVGKTPFDFMSDKEASRMSMILDLHLKNKSDIKNLENIHIHKSGHEVVVVTNAIAIFDKENNIIGYQGTDKDISNIKKTEKKLQENQKILAQQLKMAQMGEMLSMIAHQWRQPLGAISSASIDLQIKLELDYFDFGEEKKYDKFKNYFFEKLKNINKNVQNLTTTIDDFKNFYKPNKESIISQPKDIVLESLNMMNLIFDNKINIIQEHRANKNVRVYYNEMIQTILNIVKNSQDNFIQKNLNNGIIQIITDANTITICDNGGGIPEDIMDKIFNPYFSTKEDNMGTGLGLYMSKIIVEKHHEGSIKVQNTDEGVCFTIELGKVC
nr:ATP-binding protein [uncultured Sulfurimonas sp.]